MTERANLADRVVVYRGDCREVVQSLAHAGPVIMDPPYLDGDQSDVLDILDAACRVVVTPGKLEAFNWIIRKRPTWEYAWQTASKTLGGAACFHMGFEPVLSYGYPVKPPGIDIFNFPIQSGRDKPDHPWPKPVQLMAHLVEHWSNPVETVLDPFMGSGTTGVAAVQIGRGFIGIEIETKYFDLACCRILEALKQQDLFIEKPKRVKQPQLI